jgi:cytidylate kinase
MAELADRGEQADYATVLSEIVARDTQDQERPIAPLKAAADAVVVDTTGKSLDEVTAAIVALVDTALARR